MGLDTDRGEERVFRLSRVVGDARRIGAPASYDIPDGTDLREATRRLAPPPLPSRGDAAGAQGCRGDPAPGREPASRPTSPAPTSDSPWDRLVLRRGPLAEELLALGPDVYVEAPAELRDEIVARLRATVGATSMTHGRRRGGAKDQVARLLTLVPYLHCPRPGPPRRGGAGRRRPARAARQGPRRAVHVRAPGRLPRRPHRRRPRRPRGPEAGPAEGVIRISNADYLARPLRLTPTEATAIIVALRALRAGAGPDTREVVDRALAKLEAAAAAGRRPPLVDPGDDDDADAPAPAGLTRGRRAPAAARSA